jgi:hypothetical protein
MLLKIGGRFLMVGSKESSLVSDDYGRIKPPLVTGEHGVSGRKCAIIASANTWRDKRLIGCHEAEKFLSPEDIQTVFLFPIYQRHQNGNH